MSQRASVAVPAPADELYAWLREVENWPQFLEGLDAVESLGYRRYRWRITYAGRSETCDVVVTPDAEERRISWRHLAGKPFDGTLRMTPLSADRTRVDLVIDIKPVGLAQGIADFTHHTGWMAERDVQRLRDVVESWTALRRTAGDDAEERDGEHVG